ncbi:hypothetical protein OG599_14225 [Streptomyces sp. NBC_01335]|uniref:EF-Tu/IF-2/RF-3 family GTPase n=1 Tax=Streptomyces sp. NBC_01335 TaxID=2903828 RepID=UPI002E1123DC|nr:hypothetical protein OG599_14225 [Streptomyces sp. NBC_01335]
MDDLLEPFLMVVEDVFPRSQGRAALVTGRIERGRVLVGDELQIVGGERTGTPVRVAGIEGPGRTPTRVGEAGGNVGLLLPHSVADAAVRGRVLAQPGTIGAHSSFAAALALLPEEQGGAEVRTGDALVFHFGVDGVRGTVTLAPGTDVLHPLHTACVTVALDGAVALESGWHFAFRFRGRAAGTGTVTRLIGAAPLTAP